MNPLSSIDNFLNQITMYRLAICCLTGLWLVGFLFSFFAVLPFTPLELVQSSVLIFLVCIVVNWLFTRAFKIPTNPESTYITAFILCLITGPENSWRGILFLTLVSALAISSKYILAINRKHLFNPAAFAVAATGLIFNYYASWWISDNHLILFVIIAGLLLVRKLQRFDLVISFFIVYVAISLQWQHALTSLQSLFAYSPILFFMFVMLTEPQTTPPNRKLRIVYGGLVGLLLAPFVHFGTFYFAPESALIVANLFSYIVSSKQKLTLILKEKVEIAHNTFEFVFQPDKKLVFQPGQYLEWTLPHKKYDARGLRRYFTIASSPTEQDIKLGVKFYDKPSSFKQVLKGLQPGEKVVAGGLAGEFTLPKDVKQKLVFLAGGIGVTPFRSMVQYLLDTQEKRDIIMFYANNHVEDIAYKDIFDKAATNLDLRIVYVQGFISKELLIQHVPDCKSRIFYISGPRSMIVGFEETLKELGVSKRCTITDFFPGFA